MDEDDEEIDQERIHGLYRQLVDSISAVERPEFTADGMLMSAVQYAFLLLVSGFFLCVYSLISCPSLMC